MNRKLKNALTALTVAVVGVTMAFGLAACGDNGEQNNGNNTDDVQDVQPEVKNYTLEDNILTSNGQTLYTQIGVPNNAEGKLPLIIMCNGASNLYTSTDVFADYFLSKGIAATIQFDYTNTEWKNTKSTGNSIDLSITSMQNDIQAIYDYALTDSRFDAENINILGYSLGGLNATIYVSNHADKISTLFAMAPAYDMYYFARGLEVQLNDELTAVTITQGEPKWGDPYADDAPESVMYGGVVLSNEYIKQCWNLDYSKFYDAEEGFTGTTLLLVGDKDDLLAHITAVRQLYVDENGNSSLDSFMTFHIVPGADHMMAAKMPETVYEYLDAFLADHPL